MSKAFQFESIATVRSPFKEKFGIPRQPGLIKGVRGSLEMCSPYDRPEWFEGIEGISHLWLLWVFHGQARGTPKPKVRPPRLGGNQRLGVFASRSGFRPNPIGLSLVRFDGLRENKTGGVVLAVSGLDLMDGTPLLDIKPYLPYAEAQVDAQNPIAPQAPVPHMGVEFSDGAERVLAGHRDGGHLRQMIVETLALDPRPAYRGTQDAKEYAMYLADLNLRWRLKSASHLLVTVIERVTLSSV